MPALQIIDPNGEVVQAVDAQAMLAAAGIFDLADADTLELAMFDERVVEWISIAKEARGLGGDELVRRLDLDSCWTCHEGDYTITSPSPQAGTVGWHAGVLHLVLSAAVEAGAVSRSAMDAAVKDITPRPEVSYDFLRDLRELLQGCADQPTFERLTDEVAGHLASEPEPLYAVQTAGVNRLLKRGGEVADAIAWARMQLLAPRRTAKVTKKPVAA